MVQSVVSCSRAPDQLAAKLLAAAVCIRLPKVQILEARAESYGFCCEFYSTQQCSKEMLPFIEEGMYALLQQKEIQTFEMVSSNAIEFLRFHHQKWRAQELKEWSNGLVHTLKIGGYADFLEEELDLESAFEDLTAIKLIELTSNMELGPSGEPRERFRIKGISASHVRFLKEMVKKIRESSKAYHIHATQLFTMIAGEDEDVIVWQPEGVIVKRQLLAFFKEFFKTHGYQEIEISSKDLDTLLLNPQLKLGSSWFCMYEEDTKVSLEPDLGLYSLERTTSLAGVRECRSSDLARVSGDLIKKVLDLLGAVCLTFRVVENEESVHFFVKDSFEREWEVARIEMGEKKNPSYVNLLVISVERWLALLLDLFKGTLQSGFLAEIFKI